MLGRKEKQSRGIVGGSTALQKDNTGPDQHKTTELPTDSLRFSLEPAQRASSSHERPDVVQDGVRGSSEQHLTATTYPAHVASSAVTPPQRTSSSHGHQTSKTNYSNAQIDGTGGKQDDTTGSSREPLIDSHASTEGESDTDDLGEHSAGQEQEGVSSGDAYNTSRNAQQKQKEHGDSSRSRFCTNAKKASPHILLSSLALTSTAAFGYSGAVIAGGTGISALSGLSGSMAAAFAGGKYVAGAAILTSATSVAGAFVSAALPIATVAFLYLAKTNRSASMHTPSSLFATGLSKAAGLSLFAQAVVLGLMAASVVTGVPAVVVAILLGVASSLSALSDWCNSRPTVEKATVEQVQNDGHNMRLPAASM